MANVGATEQEVEEKGWRLRFKGNAKLLVIVEAPFPYELF
jgi:hypothetical protein